MNWFICHHAYDSVTLGQVRIGLPCNVFVYGRINIGHLYYLPKVARRSKISASIRIDLKDMPS